MKEDQETCLQPQDQTIMACILLQPARLRLTSGVGLVGGGSWLASITHCNKLDHPKFLHAAIVNAEEVDVNV